MEGSNTLAKHFKEEADDLRREADAIMAAEEKYVYSLAAVAGTVIGFAMYRTPDLTMQQRDWLFLLGVVSAFVSFLGGYLNRGYHIERSKAKFWSQAAKVAIQAEEIVNAANSHLPDAKKMVAEFVAEHIDKPGDRAHRRAEGWFLAQPVLLFVGALCIFLWFVAVAIGKAQR